MNVLVNGGSASGKSEFAEQLATELDAGNRKLIYLATMNPLAGGDSMQRIERHLELRRGKGFQTLESSEDTSAMFLADLEIQLKNSASSEHTVLLEDLGNMVARIVFSPKIDLVTTGSSGTSFRKDTDSFNNENFFYSQVSSAIERISSYAKNLVIVTNEIFLENLETSDEYIKIYLKTLADANSFFSKIADKVFQVVAGIPVEM